MFLVLLNSFATSIYSEISQKLGGGRPFQVELYVDEVKKQILTRVGLEFISIQAKTFLLHETNDAIFVVVEKDNNRSLVQIQKRELAGVKYIINVKDKKSK